MGDGYCLRIEKVSVHLYSLLFFGGSFLYYRE